MTHDVSDALPPTPAHDLLRRRIGWLCKIIRFAAVAYAGWILYVVIAHWADAGRLARIYSAWLKVDVSGIASWQRLAGFGVSLTIWLFAAIACYSVWRLFTGYLEGRIFTVDAAIWLRRIGFFGLIAEVLDILARPLVAGLVTLHLPPGQRQLALSFNPNDLLILLFLCGFVALAHVYKTAAEIADDNARFV